MLQAVHDLAQSAGAKDWAGRLRCQAIPRLPLQPCVRTIGVWVAHA